MRKKKQMDDAQRLSLLHEYLGSSSSKSSFEKEKGLSRKSISYWLRKFALEDKPHVVKIVMPMNSDDKSLSQLDPNDEIVRLHKELIAKELELKRVTMARDAYEKMVELAEEKYGIPIRKNSDAK